MVVFRLAARLRSRPFLHMNPPTFPPTNQGRGPTVREEFEPCGDSNFAIRVGHGLGGVARRSLANGEQRFPWLGRPARARLIEPRSRARERTRMRDLAQCAARDGVTRRKMRPRPRFDGLTTGFRKLPKTTDFRPKSRQIVG